MDRDSIVASILSKLCKEKDWRLIFGNRNLEKLMSKFEPFFDIIILPKPMFLSSYFPEMKIETVTSKFIILYTENIGIMTSKEHPKMTLRQALDKDFMSGDTRYVDKVSAFCFWSNQAKDIVIENFPELTNICYVVGHPRHDIHAFSSKLHSVPKTSGEVGIITRASLLNDYFGRNALESILVKKDHISNVGNLEYTNNQTGEQYFSLIRGFQSVSDIYIEAIDFENMLKIIHELIEKGHRVSLKIHPKEDRKLYERVFKDKLDKIFIVDGFMPFVTWAQKQKFIIGPPSTSFYDALLLGVVPISTSELNPVRKSLVTPMYEDFNSLMNFVYKPRSVKELINFIENEDVDMFTSRIASPEILEVLHKETNYPNQGDSLSKLLDIMENMIINRRSSSFHNFAIFVFRVVANVKSEFKYPYFYIYEKIYNVKLLTSANFVLNIYSRVKIKTLIRKINM